MSIDPNKTFGMKATNKSYTLSFDKDMKTSLTKVSAVDMESQNMTFGQRFKMAWAILTGGNLADQVFPIYLRNSDFYHLSYVYRPEKLVDETAKMSAAKPAKTPKAAKPKADKPAGETAKKANKPRKPRAPKKTTTAATTATPTTEA
jgi:hypothetical protein